MRKMQWLATGLLIFMSLVFLVTLHFERTIPWLQYVRAFSEASMIGALADWFAVVVLFRHPFGIPLPHTAIIPKSKDRIGTILANFVVTNFVTESVIRKHFLNKLDSGKAVSDLLSTHSEFIAQKTVSSFPKIIDYVTDDDIQSIVKNHLLPRIHKINVASGVGTVLDMLMKGDSYVALLDEGLIASKRLIRYNVPHLRKLIYQELPKLWPVWILKRQVARKISNHIVESLLYKIDDIAKNKSHPARASLDKHSQALIQKLKNSPDYQQAFSHFIQSVVENQAFSAYVASLWQDVKQSLASSLRNPSDRMKTGIESMLLRISSSIKTDTILHKKFNETIEVIIIAALPHVVPSVQKMIEKTVGSWSEKMIVDTLEPAVGRDLQFIRINGTIVGGIAGLLIYILSRLIP